MRPFTLAAVVLALLLLPATAAADGLPAAGVDARPLSVAGGALEYMTERAGTDTRLVESARYGGVVRARRLPGRWSIPAVAYDGSPSGLAADGRTLVLINPRTRIPRKRTTFAVVDPRRLRIRREIRLRGDFSFDAISPDGRLLYLIHYLSPRDVTKYAVRAYDMRRDRLFRAPVVDPSEPGEDMSGIPVTRVEDGRWAYTLYDGGRHPFVHALDTERRTAVCIDIHGGGAVWGSTLHLREGRLDVVGPRGATRARIDTATHTLIERPKRGASEPDRTRSWLLLAAPAILLLLLLLLLGAAAVRRLRRIRGEVMGVPSVMPDMPAQSTEPHGRARPGTIGR